MESRWGPVAFWPTGHPMNGRGRMRCGLETPSFQMDNLHVFSARFLLIEEMLTCVSKMTIIIISFSFYVCLYIYIKR